MSEKLLINGKSYPLWNQFVSRKNEFIGGTLEDLDMPGNPTTITDICLTANGNDSAWFEIEGEDFSCGFDAQFGALTAPPSRTDENLKWFYFTCLGGLHFRIREKHT